MTHLGQPCSLDEIIQLPQGCIAGQALDIPEQVLLLCLKQLAVVGDEQGMGPEGADVDSDDLGSVDDLSQGPHEGTVHPHQLLSLYLVGLVENNSHLVLVVLQGLDDLREFIRDVQLVSIKEENDTVNPLCEPLQYSSEVITCKGGRKSRDAANMGAESLLAVLKLYLYLTEAKLARKQLSQWTR